MKNIFFINPNIKKSKSSSFFIRHKFKFLATIICLTITLPIHSYLSGPATTDNSSYSNETQLYFNQYVNNLFKEQLSSDALSAHFYLLHPESVGLNNIPQTLGTYSYEAMQESQSYYINEINSLKSIDYDNLLSRQQLTYDVIFNYFQNQLDFADLCLCSQVLSPTTGLQAQLPILFAEYSFTNVQDIENYLTLLTQTKNYFSQICDFQKIKAEHDSFISDFTCSEIIEQCHDFISTNNIQDNILYSSFISRLSQSDFLTDQEKTDFTNRNKDALVNYVIPAYQMLINVLSDLKSAGYCKNSNGLCYLDNGKDYYEYLIKNYTGSSSSVMEIKSNIQSNLLKDMRTMYSLLTINPEIEDTFYGDATNDLSPHEILNDLTQKSQQDFPTLDNVNFEIKYVDESLQKHLSPAFYLSPPLDSDYNIIYINKNKNTGSQDIYTTLAHEGIPGHMYQSCYFSATNPQPIRHLLGCGGYTEGWATYVEFLSYYYEYTNQQLAQALSCSASYSLALYSLCDIGINYEGWTFDETKKFLSNYNLKDDTVCREIFEAVIAEPANYLQYYVGYMEIMNLKEELQRNLGETFDLKKFHEAFLSIGPADFDVVKKWIYIKLNQ